MKTPDLKAWLNARANRPLTPPSQTRVLRATFRTEEDANLAAQLLALTAVATGQDGKTVRAIFRSTPEQHQDLKMQARQLRQSLSDAGLNPTRASFSPPRPLNENRTWYRAASARTWPTRDDRESLRRRPELILVRAGIPRPQGNLKLTDESEFSQLPTPLVIGLLSAGLLSIITMVELSGTDRWSSWIVACALAILTAAGVMVAFLSHPSGQRRISIGLALGEVALGYGAGIAQARNAPGHLSWAAFAAAVIALGAYVGAASAVAAWLRSNPTSARRLGAVLTAVAAAVLASGAAPEILRTQFQHGLGNITTPITVPTLELLWALRSPMVSSLLVLAFFGLGAALLKHGAAPIPPALRHLVLLMSLSMTAVAFLMVGLGAYSLGDSIRRGDIANARGIASCVYVVDGLASVSNRQPLIMVGSASGPSLLISPAGGSTLVSDGLTVRPVPPAQSPKACAPRAETP